MALQDIKKRIEQLQDQEKVDGIVLSAVMNLQNHKIWIQKHGQSYCLADISSLFKDEVLASRLIELAGQQYNLTQKEINDFVSKFVDN